MRTRGAWRKFSVEFLEKRSVPTFRYTCKVCGWKRIQPMLIGPRGRKVPMSREMALKLARYQDQGGGASGHCPRCLREGILPPKRNTSG